MGTKKEFANTLMLGSFQKPFQDVKLVVPTLIVLQAAKLKKLAEF